MAPMMKKVEKAGRQGIMQKRKPYKISPEDFFKDNYRFWKQLDEAALEAEQQQQAA